MAEQEKLAALRAGIDQIDDQIHDLIMQRWQIVEQIGKAKRLDETNPQAATKTPVRPEREAQMFQRLLARHEGPFPAQALIRIWHELIGAFTQIQKPFKVAVVRNEAHDLSSLALEQFGSQAELISASDIKIALNHLKAENDCALAVIPFPPAKISKQSFNLYLDYLTGDGSLNVLMCLPFIKMTSANPSPQALVVGHDQPIPSGLQDDHLLSFKAKEKTHPQQFLDRLNQYLKANYTMQAQLITVSEDEDYMVRIDGFLTEPMLSLINKDLEETVYSIGAYTALSFEEKV